jgi:hypothetical protein
LCQSYVSFVFFNSDVYRAVALTNGYLPTFTRDAVYFGCSQSHGILDRWEVIEIKKNICPEIVRHM